MPDTNPKPRRRHSDPELERIGGDYVTLTMLRFVFARLAGATNAPAQFLQDARSSLVQDLERHADHQGLSDEEREIMIAFGRDTIAWVFDHIAVKRVTSEAPAARQ